MTKKPQIEIDTDLVEKIKKANVGNILKKFKAGKVLTQREIAIIEELKKKDGPTKKAEYAKTVGDLARHLPNERTSEEGISERHAATWIKRPGFPKKTKAGWNIVLCKEFCRDWLKKSNSQTSDELLREKRKREIEKLDIQIAEMRANLVPIEELLATCQEHKRIVESVFEEFTAWISAELRNPEILKKSIALCNRAKTSINERLNRAC